MRRRISITTAALGLLALGLPTAHADAPTPRLSSGTSAVPTEGGRVGGAAAPSAGPHPGSHGGTVIVDAHGLLVVERNAGQVVRCDRDGNPKSGLELHQGLGEIVRDGGGAVFVADRSADRVLALDPGDEQGKGLAVSRSVEIAEPHGLGLTPDGATLLVTSVANQELVAVDVATFTVSWRRHLAPEPRGVAVSSDGRSAAVGFLSSSAVATVELAAAGESVRWHSLDPRDRVHIEEEQDEDFVSSVASLREARSRFQVPSDTGRRQARNAYAVGFIGDDLLVAPHQLATPQMKFRPQEEMDDSYGGGAVSVPPLVHRVATISGVGTATSRMVSAQYSVHQPRGLAYDAGRDAMFLGGYGDDRVLAVVDASQQLPFVLWQANVGGRGDDACGVDGLAVDGDDLFIHCELSRRIIRLDLEGFTVGGSEVGLAEGAWRAGPQLAASLRSELVERGAELFRRGGDSRLSDNGALACASCHPEGRADGLTWRLGKSILQTPILAGRVVGTAPYKWDGQDEDLDASLHHTISRLGGFPERLGRRDFEGLTAYITSMSPPRPATEIDAEAVARGRELFASKDLACDACHDGDKLTDGQQYPLGKTRFGATDTPSLIGVAHSAPYYHDGSAGDLRTLLTDRGTVHDMAELGSLSEQQVSDLDVFLRTL
ncbi:MAG: hypothetical protein AB1Z98_27655 [Nannocystaceae bacterium]